MLTGNREERPAPRCGGGGELVELLSQDSFGNWDTREWPCPGCPDCVPPAAAGNDKVAA